MPYANLAALLSSHRSIRRFTDKPVDSAQADRILLEALQGSSSSGNLNLVSVIKTFDTERKAHLYRLHGDQPMVLLAPLVLTFCADNFRTRQWLTQRGARLNFGNFHSWHVAAFDAIILAQTTALLLEDAGMGICYMGTTLNSMQEIADYLDCPDHCLPVTSMVVGWPAEAPTQRDRLTGTAWIHNERYQCPSAEDIDHAFKEREVKGWNRYRAMGETMVQKMDALGITSLAQFYTSDMKYAPQEFEENSEKLKALLQARGFF